MDLKLTDVADLLNVSETTIRRWITDGKIPSYKMHNQYYFNRTEIEDWVINHRLQEFPASEEKPVLILDKNKGGLQQFSLYRAIHKGGVLHDIPGELKEEVIRTSMKRIAKSIGLDADVITDLLLDREALQPTALNNGIGVPHTRDFLLNTHHDIIVVAFPEHPIHYGSLDGIPVHTFFFLLACDDKRHLHLLAKLAHLSSESAFRTFLQTKPSQEALLEYIKKWESAVVHRP